VYRDIGREREVLAFGTKVIKRASRKEKQNEKSANRKKPLFMSGNGITNAAGSTPFAIDEVLKPVKT
jgi:hypothetical protein